MTLRIPFRRLALGAIPALLLFGVTAAPASAVETDAQSSDFTITSLGDADVRAASTWPSIGSDGGFTAITATQVLQTGDWGLAAYDHRLSAPESACSPIVQRWGLAFNSCPGTGTDRNAALFSDLKSQTAYLFDMTNNGSTWRFEGFWPAAAYDPSTGTPPASTRVALSEPVVMTPELPCSVTASGWGRAVIWDRCAGVLYDISLPSGTVTIDDSALIAPDLFLGRSEAGGRFPVRAHGVAEYIDGSIWLALTTGEDPETNPTSVTRFSVQTPGAAPEVIREFPATDIYAFAMSPQAGMWCAHMESGTAGLTVTSPGSDPLYCASATAEVPTEPTTPGQPEAEQPEAEAAPELAETGAGDIAPLSFAALALLIGGTVLLVSTRAIRAVHRS